MGDVQIKIGHQEQADKPIILRSSGVLICGNFTYRGPKKNQFRATYERILELVPVGRGALLDISQYQYWDAVRIYDDLVVARWVKSVGAKRLEKLAMETEVFLLLEPLRAEFRRAVGRRWRKIVRNSGPLDSGAPKQAWQIL